MVENEKIYDIRDCEVFYEGKKRLIKCPCGKTVNATILKHFKNDHPESWKRHVDEFIRLTNNGLSPKKIITEFKSKNQKLIFTWSIVENEIKKRVASGEIPIKKIEKIDRWGPNKDEKISNNTTVWSFTKRGSWAAHTGDYRGNWPPQVPRILIKKFSKKGDLIFDPFLGGGTTVMEAWLLGRRSIGIDINPRAVKISDYKINLMEQESKKLKKSPLNPTLKPKIILGSALDTRYILEKECIAPGTIDLILTHPPYFNVLKYTYNNKEDISNLNSIDEFNKKLSEISIQIVEFLKVKGYIGIMVGDVRKNGELIPLDYYIHEIFKKLNCNLIEKIIKEQHNDRSTIFYLNNRTKNEKDKRFLIKHEYILIFQKT